MFPKKDWDIGYLNKEQLTICANIPVKSKSQQHGWDFTNDIAWSWAGILNGIVLIRKSEIALDYALYDESSEILKKNDLEELDDWAHIYINFKEAAILAGIGVRARNTLVYSYRFGFDSKICVIGFKTNLTNPPNNPPNFKLWDTCTNCDLCRINCPVGAIHNKTEPNWFDSEKCNNFLIYGNHPHIPSMKQFWHKYVRPDVPQKTVDNMKDYGADKMDWNANGYTVINKATTDGASNEQIYKDGKPVSIPICRECQVQYRCSKWKGHYPYKHPNQKV